MLFSALEGAEPQVDNGTTRSLQVHILVNSIQLTDVPSEPESNNPDSILTGIRIGSVIEEQQVISIVISDEPSTQIDLKPASPVEEEEQTASILMEWEEEVASDASEEAATSDPE